MATYYLKYRPQKVEELDLDLIRESLSKIIKSGNMPHAFLFSGPKGTGKTSAARIVAKVVNCTNRKKSQIEPCNKCEQCKSITRGENIDIIEMDAASHRGIDDVRNLKDAVKLAPASAEKKVYIIDEAHMLTTEASNALLKTLEEPPEHVMFILATTNPEKLIETIRSRTTNLSFRRATSGEIVRSLKRVIRKEKIKTGSGALETIAKVSSGSFRDAVKILEQLVTEKKKITVENIEELAYRKGAFNIDKFMSAIEKKDAKACLAQIETVVLNGGSLDGVFDILLQRLRSALLAKSGVAGENIELLGKEEVIKLIELITVASLEMKSAFIEQLPLEIAIIKWCEEETEDGPDNKRASYHEGLSGKEGKKEAVTEIETEEEQGQNLEELKKQLDSFLGKVWVKVLSRVRPHNASTEALLRAAKPLGYDGRTLTLGVFYSFHKERLETAPHRMLLESVIKEITGTPVRVVCRLTKQSEREDPADKDEVVLTQSEDEDIIKVAKEIFES